MGISVEWPVHLPLVGGGGVSNYVHENSAIEFCMRKL